MDTTVTAKELYMAHAPSFNFELDQEQLLAKALQLGFVTTVGDDQYKINGDY